MLILTLGWFGGIIHNYFNPNVITYHAARDPEFGLRAIKEMLSENPALNDAVAVIATQSATQYGKEFFNTISSEGRPSIIAHPYDKQGSGVTVTVSYRDEKTNTRKILLLRKLNKRNTPAKGCQDLYTMVAGYAKGAAVEGGQINKLAFIEGEARDAVEDEYLITGALKRIAPPKKELKEEKTFVKKRYFEEIKKHIMSFFHKKLETEPYIANFDPSEIKAYLQSKGFTYNRDYNYIDTAMREFKEESGYNGPITASMFNVCYTSDNYAVSNVPELHTIVTYLVLDLGTLKEEPKIYAIDYTGVRVPNSLQPNGTEIGEIVWVSASAIEPDKNEKPSYNKIPIYERDIPVHHKTLKQLRDKELSVQSKGLITTSDQLQQFVNHMGLTFTVEKLTTEFGKKAEQSHQFNHCVAHEIGLQTHINAETISAAWHKCKRTDAHAAN